MHAPKNIKGFPLHNPKRKSLKSHFLFLSTLPRTWTSSHPPNPPLLIFSTSLSQFYFYFNRKVKKSLPCVCVCVFMVAFVHGYFLYSLFWKNRTSPSFILCFVFTFSAINQGLRNNPTNNTIIVFPAISLILAFHAYIFYFLSPKGWDVGCQE